MNTKKNYREQLELALDSFGHIIENGEIIRTPAGPPKKLRLYVIDNSIVDVFLSPSGRYSYHWERRHLDETIYRHDNAPHQEWDHLETYPKHFHHGTEKKEDIRNSYINDEPTKALKEFLDFVESEISNRFTK